MAKKETEDHATLTFLTSLKNDLASEHFEVLATSVASASWFSGLDWNDDPETIVAVEEGNKKQRLTKTAELLVRIFFVVRPDIKYFEGMALLAGMILAVLGDDAHRAISCFLNLLHQNFFLDFFSMRWGYMRMRFDFFNKLMDERMPYLVDHFSLLHITPDMYFLPWLLSGFTRILPFKYAARVWDGFVLIGEVHFFTAALALLSLFEHSLMTQGFSGCIETLLGRIDPRLFDEEKFFRLLQNEPVNTERHAAWLSTQVLAEEKQTLYDLLLV